MIMVFVIVRMAAIYGSLKALQEADNGTWAIYTKTVGGPRKAMASMGDVATASRRGMTRLTQ